MNLSDLMPNRSRAVGWLSIFLLAALLISTIPAAAATGSVQSPDLTGLNWLIDTVDSAQQFENMSSRSIRLDSNGNPVIAYGGRKLYFARYTGSKWSISVADGSYGVGSYASLDLDSSNRPHISYYDAINGKLKYASIYNDVWEVETITEAGDSGANVGMYTSLEIDSDNRPHISYYDATYQELDYIYQNSNGDWVKNVVNTVGSVGKYSSLYLNGDKPHISYYNESSDALMHAYKDSSGVWRNDFIDSRQAGDPEELTGVGLYSSIIMDSRGIVHISYYDAVRGNLKYARINGSSKDVDTVQHINGEKNGLFTSIALNNNREPRISYFNETQDDLKFAYLTDSGWKFTTISHQSKTGLYTSMAVNHSNNRTYISFYDFYKNKLMLASLNNDKWSLTEIDAAGTTGVYNSMKLDSSDRAHIAYYDESSPGLRYARWTGSNWERWELDSGPSVGLYATLALDSNNYPQIAYYEGATNELYYIRWTGTKWTGTSTSNDDPSIVDTTGDVGKYASIAVDSNNFPHISYFDQTNRVLKYAYWNGSTWTTQIIDNSGDTGYYTSIAIDSQNAPHIAYFEEQNDELRYAYYVPSTGRWEYETADNQGSVGTYASLALDSHDLARISYYDFTPNITPRLKFAQRIGPNDWQTSVVDGEPLTQQQMQDNPYFKANAPDVVDAINASGGVGMYSSLALDSMDQPHISYYDAENQSLKYAFWSPTGWQTRTVYKNKNDAGEYTSIGVGSDNNPRIAFHDTFNRELKYARAAQLDYEFFLPFSSK